MNATISGFWMVYEPCIWIGSWTQGWVPQAAFQICSPCHYNNTWRADSLGLSPPLYPPLFPSSNHPSASLLLFPHAVLMPGLFTSFLDEHYQNTNCFNTKFQNTSKETQFLLPVSSLRGEIPFRNKGLHSSCKDRMKHCWTQHQKTCPHFKKQHTDTQPHWCSSNRLAVFS